MQRRDWAPSIDAVLGHVKPYRPLDQEFVSLASKGPLILEPSSIVGNTANLLAIVVWDRVVDSATRRIGSMACNVSVEVSFFLRHSQHIPESLGTNYNIHTRVICSLTLR